MLQDEPMSDPGEVPKFELRSVKLSTFFRNFADVLDNPDRIKIIQEQDEKNTLLRIVLELKRYAWEKCGGVDLSGFGTPDDKSLAIGDTSECVVVDLVEESLDEST